MRESVDIREGGEDVRAGINLVFCGYSVIRNLILGVEHERDSCGYTTDGDSSLGGRVDEENDAGTETGRSSVHPVRHRWRRCAALRVP